MTKTSVQKKKVAGQAAAPSVPDYKVVPLDEACSKRIEWAYDLGEAWKSYRVDTHLPARSINCDMPMGTRKGALLVLDPYGDDIMSAELRSAVLGESSPYKDRMTTIGIVRKTGEIVQVSFITYIVCGACGDELRYALMFSPMQSRVFVPKPWIGRLGELKNKKRPFILTLPDFALFRFCDRWESYADLQSQLVVELSFDDAQLQVSSESFRSVQKWQTAPDHP